MLLAYRRGLVPYGLIWAVIKTFVSARVYNHAQEERQTPGHRGLNGAR
jgi:hypothetical protein